MHTIRVPSRKPPSFRDPLSSFSGISQSPLSGVHGKACPSKWMSLHDYVWGETVDLARVGRACIWSFGQPLRWEAVPVRSPCSVGELAQFLFSTDHL